MPTGSSIATVAAQNHKLRSDDIFFLGMAVLILGIVVTGFAQSYFLAGMIRAKLPNTLVHIHGAIFVTWLFFLLFQTSLVAARKVKLHVSLGIVGVILPRLMVILGVLTLMDSIRRAKLDIPPELILVGGLENLILLSFSTAGHFSLVAILPPTEWSALRAAQLFSLRDFIRFNDLPTKCTTYVYTKFRIG